MADITFRYNRAPTGELSGASMVEQTEQALSEISREASQAETDSAEALRVAQIAETHASEAQTTATTAQETATAAGQAAATAQTTANNAVTTAQGAQSAAQGAAQTATAAAQSAANAQTAAQTAAQAAQQSEAKADQAVQTAGQAVQTAGQAVTTANSAVTRAEQAETNVGNAVTAAQAAQTAAAQSAASAAELADPNRYSAKITDLTLTAGQTINYSDLDNSNVAVGNRILDAVGNIFQVASIDSANQVLTLVAANPDSTPPTTGFWENPAVRVSGAQSVSGVKTFTDSPLVPTLADRFDKSLKAINSTWAYGLATKGNHLEMIDLGTPDDDFWDSIANGTFSHAPVGGYFVINNHPYYIVDQDYWKSGNVSITNPTRIHHVAVATGFVAGTKTKLNTAATNAGGYAGCDFRTGNNGNTVRQSLISIIETDFGSGHLLTYKDRITNAVTNGYPSGVVLADMTVELMTECQVFGSRQLSPMSNGSTISMNRDVSRQFELFRRRPDQIANVSLTWLRDLMPGGTGFCYISDLYPDAYAANSEHFVKPCFALCKSTS